MGNEIESVAGASGSILPVFRASDNILEGKPDFEESLLSLEKTFRINPLEGPQQSGN